MPGIAVAPKLAQKEIAVSTTKTKKEFDMKKLLFTALALGLASYSSAYAGSMDKTQEQVDDSVQQQEDWSDELNPTGELDDSDIQEQEEVYDEVDEMAPEGEDILEDDVQMQQESEAPFEDTEYLDNSSDSIEEEASE